MPATPPDDIRIPARREATAPPPAQIPADTLATRKKRRAGRILLLALAFIIVLPPTLILLGRWVPITITSYLLQSQTRPTQHIWVPRERIAESARRAVVASEDQKFWIHHGFDVEAMQEAYARNQRGGRVRGGSTISQQTAKNLFLWPGGGYLRKGIEAGLTVLIEALWGKDRILEVYLNSAEFGPGIYGIEAAAEHFFNKPAAQLSPSEAARLAAVLPNPRKWKVAAPGPYVQSRAAWILRQMNDGGRSAEPYDAEPPPPPGEAIPDDDDPMPTPRPASPAAETQPEQPATPVPTDPVSPPPPEAPPADAPAASPAP